MSRSITFYHDIDLEDFYDELHDSDKEQLLEWLKEENFITDENEDVEDKFENLKNHYFRFTKEDEEVLENLFNKYNI